MDIELQLLWAALVCYTGAGVAAIFGVALRRLPERAVLALIAIGLLIHATSISMRWERLGHGPYITMFEILSSNIWSLLLVFALAYWRYRPIRPIAAAVMPVLFVMMGWLLVVDPGAGHLPSTYHTVWLYIHILLGKVFLGAALVAVGLSTMVLLREAGLGERALARMPGNAALMDLAYRFLALGLVFDTLMLVTGAIWAQDAWGRYWSWDPLETWAFLTWLILVFALHCRVTLRPGPMISAMLAITVFVIAFLTFFGIPFISPSAHKGAV